VLNGATSLGECLPMATLFVFFLFFFSRKTFFLFFDAICRMVPNQRWASGAVRGGRTQTHFHSDRVPWRHKAQPRGRTGRNLTPTFEGLKVIPNLPRPLPSPHTTPLLICLEAYLSLSVKPSFDTEVALSTALQSGAV
jgi:hypothetical protein